MGRWLSVDPLADIYPGWSPYNYTLCNPLNFIDPNGLSVAEMAKKADDLYGTKYSNARTDPSLGKDMTTGYNSDGGMDCCAFAALLNAADSDSRVVLKMGSVETQANAFKNAGDAGSYITTTDPIQIRAGDYLFLKSGNRELGHVMVALNKNEDGSLEIASASSKAGKIQKATFQTNNNYLVTHLRGIGRVNRSGRDSHKNRLPTRTMDTKNEKGIMQKLETFYNNFKNTVSKLIK